MLKPNFDNAQFALVHYTTVRGQTVSRLKTNELQALIEMAKFGAKKCWMVRRTKEHCRQYEYLSKAHMLYFREYVWREEDEAILFTSFWSALWMALKYCCWVEKVEV